MRKQLTDLRRRMVQEKIDAYLIPSDDFHGSEYVGDHFNAAAMSPALPAARVRCSSQRTGPDCGPTAAISCRLHSSLTVPASHCAKWVKKTSLPKKHT